MTADDSITAERTAVDIWRTKDLQEYILTDLEKRIKKDKSTKLSVFYTCLSAYLREPMNLFLKGPSGSGKTYNSVQTAKYFSRGDDVWFLGGLSPKALIHDYGVLLNKHGEEIDLDAKPTKPSKPTKEDCKKAEELGIDAEEKFKEAVEQFKEDIKAWREELQNSYRLIDLSHKIVVFLEAPDYNTYRMLLPILSHDTLEITYKFTDKTAQGSLRTIKVVISGWPATIFLTTDRKYMEELATRSFTVTPETSTEKIKEANELTNQKDCYPWKYTGEAEETRVIEKLIESIKNQFALGTTDEMDVLIPFTNIHELFSAEIVRDMRDFAHFMQFLKAVTALHFWQRPFMKKGDKRFLMSTVEDVQRTLQVYQELFETTRTGTEQKTLDFYHNIVKTEESCYLKDLTEKYNAANRKKLSSDSIRKMLERLSEIGYVDVQPDPTDKRQNIYRPLMKEEKAEIHRKFENPLILGSELEKGFEEWKKIKESTRAFTTTKIFRDKTAKEKILGEN